MKKISPIATDSGGIRIQFMLNRKRYNLTPIISGRFTNKSDYNYACVIAQQISRDIDSGNFDSTLSKYSPKPMLAVEKEAAKGKALLIDVWNEYTENRKKIVSENTYKFEYGKVRRTIEDCPYSSIDKSKEIIRWINNNKPSGYSAYLLQQFNACCKWAVKIELLATNPFQDYRTIVGKKKNKEEYDIDPFSEDERLQIVNAFEDQYPYLVNLVQFIFTTGCRPSEAVALTWDDCRNGTINFNKTYVKGTTENKLKTQTKRIITQNQKTKDILASQAKLKKVGDSIIFPGKRGDRMNWSYLSDVIWPKVLKSLPGIAYKTPYQMRHTFITLALKAGVSPQDVAKHVGNSPEMIFKHYAGVSRNFVMPEI